MSCDVNKVITIAKAEIGYLEKASNANLDSKTANAGKNNYTKYARDMDKISGFYNGRKQSAAWCDVFVDWCFIKAYGVDNAKKLLCQPSKSLGAGCKYSMQYYKNKGQLKTSPKVGDQIFFKNSAGTICHTGLVYHVDKYYVYTVEGNTSSESGVVANGGGVRAKKYALSYNRIAGYGRPNYDIKVTASAPVIESRPAENVQPQVLEWQKAAKADGFKFPVYGEDGQWGAECENVAKKAIIKKRVLYTYKNLTKIVQRAVGVSDDGLCGPQTVEAIKTYQMLHGLTPDGQVGLNTWKKILGVA